MNSKIRKMKLEDITAIMVIEKELFSSVWEEEMFIEEIEKQYAYILELEGSIIGYICGWKLHDEFNITNIAIVSEFQRKGFGEKLVQFIMTKLLDGKCYKFFLEVRSSNYAAKQLYDKMGFILLRVRNKYYKFPEDDALVMGVNLMDKLIKDKI
ncbi:MAG: ribosomal protein S18-alanine N-acetyltransferase [Candidatus Tenebribacter davisii]|nr:ribosomal protein S18-alanine N-acetyltransferase [Candidatus Tenebribacter davisii]